MSVVYDSIGDSNKAATLREVPDSRKRLPQQGEGIRSQQERKVNIPDGISAGFLIGSNGLVQKGVQNRFNVRSSVDEMSKCVTLQGDLTDVDAASEHLEEMMKTFQISNKSAYPHSNVIIVAWKDGPTGNFTFKHRASCPAVSTDKHSNYPFDLVMCSQENEHDLVSTSDNSVIPALNPWIIPLNEALISERLDRFNGALGAKIKLSFGKQAFRQSAYNAGTIINWEQLTSMLVGRKNLRNHWINVLDLKVPSIGALHRTVLNEATSKNSVPIPTVTVYLKNHLSNSSFRIKFRYDEESKKWVMKSCHAHRTIHALVNVVFSSDIQVRARLISRGGKDNAEAMELVNCIRISTYGSDVYNTHVYLHGAPMGLFICETMISVKTKILIDGVRFVLDKPQGFTRMTMTLDPVPKPPKFGHSFCELIRKVTGFLKRE